MANRAATKNGVVRTFKSEGAARGWMDENCLRGEPVRVSDSRWIVQLERPLPTAVAALVPQLERMTREERAALKRWLSERENI